MSDESKHAQQDFKYENECPDTSLIQINRLSLDSKKNSYITSSAKNAKNSYKKQILHMLQPIEKEAYDFCQKEQEEFLSVMSEMFPMEQAYKYNKDWFNMSKIIEDAKLYFWTNDPIKDIENILRVVNGELVETRINVLMIELLAEEEPEIYQRFEYNQKINEQIMEQEVIQKENVCDNGYIDMDDLFGTIDERDEREGEKI